MRRYFIILFYLLPMFAAAQSIEGIWKGTLTQNTGGCFTVYHIELQLRVYKDTAFGASYHYSDVNNYVKKKFRGGWDAVHKSLTLREGEVQTFQIPKDCVPCIKNYTLQYSRTDDVESLRGAWSGKVMNSPYDCQPGLLVLSRVAESAFAGIPEIEVDTGSIRLDFYDNGEVDDDSISVYVNKQSLLSHQKLSGKPSTAYIRIDSAHSYQEVEMVAENLGRIPPNTALLVVTAGAKRHKLFLTSTKDKSARVRFVLDESRKRVF